MTAKTKIRTVHTIRCAQKVDGEYVPRIFCFLKKRDRDKMLKSLNEDEVFSSFTEHSFKMKMPVPMRRSRRSTIPADALAGRRHISLIETFRLNRGWR